MRCSAAGGQIGGHWMILKTTHAAAAAQNQPLRLVKSPAAA
jgi:hypothetical protein